MDVSTNKDKLKTDKQKHVIYARNVGSRLEVKVIDYAGNKATQTADILKFL